NRHDIESTADPKNQDDYLVLFIHGFSSSKYNWLDPDIGNMGWLKDYRNEPEPIDCGWHALPPPPFFVVNWSLSKQLTPIGATEFMDKKGIEWLTYSQKSPFGPIEESVIELATIIKAIKEVYGNRKQIIIAHSRGGLISKRYLDITPKTNIEKLITFGTPFGGTFLSSFNLLRIPSKYFLKKVKPVRHLWDLEHDRKIESVSTKQMVPDSDFLKGLLVKVYRDDVKIVNIAGSSSHITNVYTWRWKLSSLKRNKEQANEKSIERDNLIKEGKPPIEWYNLPSKPKLHVYNWTLVPRKIISIYPRIGLLEVLQGDGAVSIQSALLIDDSVKQYVIHKNHMEISCCLEGYEIMLREIHETINENR
ncbi:MAG: hypothetical protein ACTSSH_03855, partial [Candidatus Heimdallarchaeota archaeon]